MISCVTQNFQSLSKKNGKKNALSNRPASSKQPQAPQLRPILIDKPVPKYQAKPLMLLPKSIKIEQSPLEFFQSYNDSLYENILKVKRRNVVRKYNSSRVLSNVNYNQISNPATTPCVSSLGFHRQPASTPINGIDQQQQLLQQPQQQQQRLFRSSPGGISDVIQDSLKQERLDAFVNNITQKHRKTSLAPKRPTTKEVASKLRINFVNMNISTTKLLSYKPTTYKQTDGDYDLDGMQGYSTSTDQNPNRIEINLQHHSMATPSEELFGDDTLMDKTADESGVVVVGNNTVLIREPSGISLDRFKVPILTLQQSTSNLTDRFNRHFPVVKHTRNDSVDKRHNYDQSKESFESNRQRFRAGSSSFNLKPNQNQNSRLKLHVRGKENQLISRSAGEFERYYAQLSNSSRDLTSLITKQNNIETQISQTNELNNQIFVNSEYDLEFAIENNPNEETLDDQSFQYNIEELNQRQTEARVHFETANKKLQNNESKKNYVTKKDTKGKSTVNNNKTNKKAKSKQDKPKAKGRDSILKKTKDDINSNGFQNSNQNLASNEEVTLYPSLIHKLHLTSPSPLNLPPQPPSSVLEGFGPLNTELDDEEYRIHLTEHTSSRSQTLLPLRTSSAKTTESPNKKNKKMDAIEPQTLMAKLYNNNENKNQSNNLHSNQNNNHNNKFNWPRRVITNVDIPTATTKKPHTNHGHKREAQLNLSLMHMLEFELAESKKDDITLQSIFNSLKETKINTSVGRLALSKSVCRFELPMDMKLLETMEPIHYLRNYCKINERRKALYKRVFEKYKGRINKEDALNLEQLEDSLMDVHMKSITKNQFQYIVKLCCLPAEVAVNFQLFCGIAALSERALYSQFVTEDTMDLPEYQKDKIESADFESLKSKLEGIHISANMLRILEAL